MRTVALLLLIVAGLLLLRAGMYLVLPRLRTRMRETELAYAERLKDLFQPMSSARTITMAQYVGSAIAGLLVLVATHNVVFALVTPPVCFVIPKFIFDRLRTSRRKRFERQLPDALRVMADAARAGLSLPQMIRLVATQGQKPIAEEFGLVVHAMDLGDSVEDALKRVGSRLAIPNFDLMTIAVVVNRDRGGDVVSLFARLADSIRALSEAEEKIETETASIRLSAKIMLGTIPVFTLALLVIDPTAVAALFTTTAGAIVLVIVFLLATTGYQMIQRLANPEI